MRTWHFILAALLTASCGPAGKRPRCDSEADCALGLHCDRAVPGERGVCVATPCPAGCAPGLVCADDGATCAAAYAVALLEPAASTSVGAAGKAVSASLTLGSSAVAQPSTLDLLADGEPAGALGAPVRDGLLVSYSGTYVPAAGQDGPVSLQAVAARGLPEEAASAPLALDVDTEPPAIGSPSATCDQARCLRDGVLTLAATVTDRNPVHVTASLDLDVFARRAPLAPGQGAAFSAALALKDWPFPAFTRSVVARIRAVDAAGNEAASPDLPAIGVTRLRWEQPYRAPAAMTSPAVAYDPGAGGVAPPALADGSLLVGVSQFTDQLRAVRPDGTEAWRRTLEASAGAGRNVSSAPSLGATAIWVSGDDGVLYGVDPSRLDEDPDRCSRSPAGGALLTPALTAPAPGSSEVAYSARADGPLCAATSDATCNWGGTTDVVKTSPVLVDGRIYLAAETTTPAVKIDRFSDVLFDGSVTLPSGALGCTSIVAQLAVDAAGDLLVACGSASTRVFKVELPELTASLLAELDGVVAGSIVVFPGGDLLVGTSDRWVRRLSPGGATVWSAELPGAVTGVLVAAPDASGVTAYAVTSDGVFALDAAGAVVWSAPLGGAPDLRSPTIAPPPPGAPETTLPTLHAGSAALHAVIVDTGLDPASPWPKLHHDLRNTNDWNAPRP